MAWARGYHQGTWFRAIDRWELPRIGPAARSRAGGEGFLSVWADDRVSDGGRPSACDAIGCRAAIAARLSPTGCCRLQRLWCKHRNLSQAGVLGLDVDHAPSTAFQISGAVLF